MNGTQTAHEPLTSSQSEAWDILPQQTQPWLYLIPGGREQDRTTITGSTASFSHIVNDYGLTGDNVVRHGVAASRSFALPSNGTLSQPKQGFNFTTEGAHTCAEFRLFTRCALYRKSRTIMKFYLKMLYTNLFQELILRAILLFLFWWVSFQYAGWRYSCVARPIYLRTTDLACTIYVSTHPISLVTPSPLASMHCYYSYSLFTAY